MRIFYLIIEISRILIDLINLLMDLFT